MIYTIEVTEEDIKNGQPRSAYLCPIALAVKRAVHCDHVTVFTNINCSFDNFARNVKVPTPIESFRWLRKFDNKEAVPLLTFEIELS